MKRPCLSVLIALLLCLLILPVLAENAAFETLPEQIQQLWLDEYAPEDFTDALTFALPDGQTCGLILTKYGRLDGYFPQADAYEMQWSTHSLNGPGLRPSRRFFHPAGRNALSEQHRLRYRQRRRSPDDLLLFRKFPCF